MKRCPKCNRNYADTLSFCLEDGTSLEPDYDPSDRNSALAFLARKAAEGEIVTGLLYVDPDAPDLHDGLNTVTTPLNQLGDADLIPPVEALEKINAGLR